MEKRELKRNILKEKTTIICFLVSAVGFYLISIVEMFSEGNNSIQFMCLGSSFLFLAVICQNDQKNKKM